MFKMNRIPYFILCSACYHPLLIAIKKAAPALSAGNCVVLKPPEAAPVVSIYICIYIIHSCI